MENLALFTSFYKFIFCVIDSLQKWKHIDESAL